MLKYDQTTPLTDGQTFRLLRRSNLLSRLELRRLKSWISRDDLPLPQELNPALELVLFVQVLPPTPSLH